MATENEIEEISIHREGKTPFICYNINNATFSHPGVHNDNIPHWVQLEYKQCPNCPLRLDNHIYCPLCLTLYPLLIYFSDVSSIEQIKIAIKESLFSTQIDLPAQDSLLILLPYLAILSGCPHWQFNKWGYRYFSYSSDYKFWVFKVLSMALVRDFLLSDEIIDKNKLLMKVQRRLDTLRITIDSFIMRIRGVLEKDASINAFIAAINLTSLLEMEMDQRIEELKKEIILNSDVSFKDGVDL